jgi:hypothetical protein
MEAAGLAIGTVALIGIFQNCVQLLSQIGAARSINEDYAVLTTRLDFQKLLLQQWADRLNLSDTVNYDKRLDDPAIRNLIIQGLGCIHQLLQEGNVLQQRYGVRPVNSNESIQTSTTLSIRTKSPFRRKPKSPSPPTDIQSVQLGQTTHSDLPLSERHENKHFSIATLKWVAKDKEEFEDLVQSLASLINDINAVIPSQIGVSANAALQHEITKPRSIHGLEKTKSNLSKEGNHNLCSIQQSIDEKCKRSILDRLWFHLIDERKDSVSTAHSETFNWAIRPPGPGSNWSDLSSWLQSESGIYWIHGKPGSGKSTLMKYIFEHHEVLALLQDWAGNRKLTMAAFFLWNVGTSEQNTQHGLARGLLYHVLKENQSLIPVVLPRMWEEAQRGVTDMRQPSSNELNQAFQQLGKKSSQGAFAFFIDGIDEFQGSHREGISFIQKLATSVHIKILLSSRPIDSCVAVFRQKPQLKLQELTKKDIEKYINDTIWSHPYLDDSSYLDEKDVRDLIMTLQRKAEGVFLWVVLACRTLLDRFDAYDSTEELQITVDQLPPELEDLFRSILESVPHIVRQQTAKLLRICHTNSSYCNVGIVATFPLAWADEKGMSLDKMEEFTPYSLDEMRQKSATLEGRLRSRCRGLLEVHGDTSKDDLRSHYKQPSYVDFMHRTVFEFLSNRDVMGMECLNPCDDEFDPTATLAYMSCCWLYLQKTPLIKEPSTLRSCFHLLVELNRSSSSNLPRTLHHLVIALKAPRSSDFGPRENWAYPIGLPAHLAGDPDNRVESLFGFSKYELFNKHAALLLATELNLTTYVQNSNVKDFNAVQKRHYEDPSERRNLLFHAIAQPVLASLECAPLVGKISSKVIDTLLESGCDLNQTVLRWDYGNEREEITTPWLLWLKSRCFRGGGDWKWVFETTQITTKMLRAGADLLPKVRTPFGDLRTFLRDQLEFWRLFCDEGSGRSPKEHSDSIGEWCMEIEEAIQSSLRDTPEIEEEEDESSSDDSYSSC